MMTLYACLASGNCFKPWLAMKQLNKEFDLKLIDVLQGEQREATYLAVNPLGVLPYLLAGDGAEIGESNAILWYLAEGTALMPNTAQERAEALQWMFFEQSKLEPFISPARFFTTILPEKRATMADPIAEWQGKAKPGLRRLDNHLCDRKFVLKSGYSVADIALFGYVHLLDDTGLYRSDYSNIDRWVHDVTMTDGFKPLSEFGQTDASPVRLAG